MQRKTKSGWIDAKYELNKFLLITSAFETLYQYVFIGSTMSKFNKSNAHVRAIDL